MRLLEGAGLLLFLPLSVALILRALVWDYTNRRTDDPSRDDRSDSFSISQQPKAERKPQQKAPKAAAAPKSRGPLLSLDNSFEKQRQQQGQQDIAKRKQELAASAAQNVMAAAEQALQACGSELKLRQLNNDRVGSLEWDRVRSILENAQQSNASGAAVPSSQDLAQAYQGGDEAVAMMIAQSAAEQQAKAELRRLLQAAKDMGS